MSDGGSGGAGPGLAAELTAALDGTPGAWDGWNAADDRTRELFAAWVAEPRGAGARRARADWTAYYAEHGILRHAVVRSGRSELVEEAGLEAADAAAETAVVGLLGRLVHLVGHMIN